MQTRSPENTRARPALLVALVVIALVATTVYFREGESGPFHQSRRMLMAASAPFETAGEFVTRPLRAVGSWVSSLGISRAEVALLKRQNAELKTRNAELEEARQENERLRSLVKFVEARGLESLGARVIARAANSWEGMITIDRGTAEGVEAGMPVIGDAGLLGQVVEAAKHSSRVRLITDQRSGVAALVQRTRVEGIVHGSIDRSLTLDFVSRDSSLRVGDVVITSGMGGVYPKGLVIGEVTAVRQQPNTLPPMVSVQPTAQLSNIEEVLVLVGAAPIVTSGSGE
jgi:rod shape-determining protein MreC